MTDFAVPSGSEMARFLGTSSPNTIDSTVATIRARITPTDCAASSLNPMPRNGPAISEASEGSITKPSASVVTVMPTWAPDSCVDSDFRPMSSDLARPSPAAACCATLALSTVTRLNSAAT